MACRSCRWSGWVERGAARYAWILRMNVEEKASRRPPRETRERPELASETRTPGLQLAPGHRLLRVRFPVPALHLHSDLEQDGRERGYRQEITKILVHHLLPSSSSTSPPSSACSTCISHQLHPAQKAKKHARQPRHISQLARLDEVSQRQRQSEENARAADGDVGDPKERVPATEERDGAEDDRLGSSERLDGVVCGRSLAAFTGPKGEVALMEMSSSYCPAAIDSSSFRKYSFLNVGNPAVRIQTWKCSSDAKSGNAVSPSAV